MPTKDEVESFIKDFTYKLTFHEQFVFERDDREKNQRTILDLEMSMIDIIEILKKLKVENYYKGPAKDNYGGPDLWEFGKSVQGTEIYIKVTLGLPSKRPVCISFHYPEREITYPFR